MGIAPFVLASGIAPEGMLSLGFALVVPIVVVVFVQASALKFFCRVGGEGGGGVGFWVAVRASLCSSVVAATAGVGLYLLFAALIGWVPGDLDRYFFAMFVFAMVRYVGYFFLSWLLESMVVRWMLRAIEWRPIARAVLVGNLVSYAILCPFYYLATAPHHNFAALRSDARWVADSSAMILYVDPSTGHLMQSCADGLRVQTLVPHEMTDYQITPDFQRCLFVNGSKLFFWSRSAEQVREIATLDVKGMGLGVGDRSVMAAVTMSPSGKRVAFMAPIAMGPLEDPSKSMIRSGYSHKPGYRLRLYNVETQRVVDLPSSLDREQGVICLAWSTNEQVIMCRKNDWKDKAVLQLWLGRNFDQIAEETSGVGTSLAASFYGTFGTGAPGLPPYQLTGDQVKGHLYATVWRTPGGSHVKLSRVGLERGREEKDSNAMVLSDNEILRFAGRHQFADVGVIPNSHLCVLEEQTYRTLYVIDAQTRTLGRLCAGGKMVLLTEKYQPAKFFWDMSE